MSLYSLGLPEEDLLLHRALDFYVVLNQKRLVLVD